MGAEDVWTRILASMDGKAQFGRAGCIPVHDGSTWRVFKNSLTVYPGVENCADPAKVDTLRDNVNILVSAFPETIPQLEKLGVRVKALLNRRIVTFEDVVAWADSVFNFGPVSKEPQHVHDTADLAFDDYVVEVKQGRNPVYVIPASPKGSGDGTTLDFSRPGIKARYGPRHEYSKTAFAKQIPKRQPRPPRYRGHTGDGEPQRPRGRPRKDGLLPGSPEARRANRKKLREREARRAARQARQAAALTENLEETMASITPLKPSPVKRLSRRADREAQRRA